MRKTYAIFLLFVLVANGFGDNLYEPDKLTEQIEELESDGEEEDKEDEVVQFIQEESSGSGSGVTPPVSPSVVKPPVGIPDPCNSNPCKNGGNCSKFGFDKFQCNCKGTGFKGSTCNQDINECKEYRRPCQDICVNTLGSFYCKCSDPQLSLAPDSRHCIAEDVDLACRKNSMTITLPKSLLVGLDREHLRLIDVRCKATENRTHYFLSTRLTGCKTRLKKKGNFFVYSNMVSEIPIKPHQIVTRVRDAMIPFHCIYSRWGVVSSVGLKPMSKKVMFSSKNFGKFTITLDLYNKPTFKHPFSHDDYPVMFQIRQRMFFELRVDTKDRRLTIFALHCFATPYQSIYSRPRYFVIRNGCPVDNTLKFHRSPNKQTQRFSLEAFQYVSKHPYVFMHCEAKICNATDPNSRCAQGCMKRGRRSENNPETADNAYPLSQGPLALDREKREVKADETVEADESMRAAKSVTKRSSYQTPVVAALGVLIGVCVLGMSYMAWQKKRANSSGQYKKLYIQGESD